MKSALKTAQTIQVDPTVSAEVITSKRSKRSSRTIGGSWRGILLLAVLLAAAAFLWTAPQRAERALQYAPLSRLEAVVKESSSAKAYYYLGLRRQKLGLIAEAQSAFAHAAALDSDNELSWLAWAEATDERGGRKEAQGILNAYLKLHPQSPAAHLAMARIYRRAHLNKQAVTESQEALRIAPDDPVAYRLMGRAAMGANDMTSAIKPLERAIELADTDWGARVDLGNALVELHREAEAIPHFRRAVELNKNEGETYFSLGRSLLSLASSPQQVQEAQDALLQSLRLRPDIPRTYLLLGQSFTRQNRLQDAIQMLDRLDGMHVDSSEILSKATYQKAAIYRRLGDTAAADREEKRHAEVLAYRAEKDHLVDTILKSPQVIEERWELARRCAKQGEYEDAVAAYRRLLEIVPDSEAARRELEAVLQKQAETLTPHTSTEHEAASNNAPSPDQLLADADALTVQKRWKEAETAYRTIADNFPGMARAYEGCGLALLAQDQQTKTESAFYFLQRAVDIDSHLPQAAAALAHLYQEAGFRETAIYYFEHAVREKPANADYWHALGMAYGSKDKQWDKAKAALQKAVTLNGNNVTYALDLAEAQSASEQRSEAEATYRRALAIAPDSAEAQARLGGFLLDGTVTAERITEGQRLLVKSLAAQKDDPYVLYSLGRAAQMQKDDRQALKYFQQALSRSPDIAEAWYALSRSYRSLGQKANADVAEAASHKLRDTYTETTHTEELLKNDPKNAALHLKLARLNAAGGLNARALNQYDTVLQTAPQDVAVRKEREALAARLKAEGHLPSQTLFNAMIASYARTHRQP